MLTADEYQTLQDTNRILALIDLPLLTEEEFEEGVALVKRYQLQGEA